MALEMLHGEAEARAAGAPSMRGAEVSDNLKLLPQVRYETT